jgi:hypothetical protein
MSNDAANGSWVEWAHGPQIAEVFVIREDGNFGGKPTFRAFHHDGRPLYLGAQSREELEKTVRRLHAVRDIVHE